MTGQPDGVSDSEAMGAVVAGVRHLTGHQVVTLEEAWSACTGLDREEMGPEQAKRLRWLLEELGYELRWVAELGRLPMLRRWVREPWTKDFVANLNREFVAYVPMD